MVLSRTFILIVTAGVLAGCGSSKSSTSGTAGQGSGSSTVLVGAGSTFVYPLVSRWISDYAKSSGVTVTYGAVGSGAGIAAIIDGSVDFGASDAPLSPDQASACKGCIQIPWALSGTSVAYNVPGASGHLRLNGTVLAEIFLGTIKTWNDPAIARLNPGARLPSTKIIPVFRSDASGTSYNFTDYLSTVSPEWKMKIGVATQPAFPAGEGAKGSSGVAGIVSKAAGAIGYVDVAYAQASRLPYAAIQNTAGTFVLPDVASIKAAAAASPSPKPNAAISIVQPPASAPAGYPISTFTYVIVPRNAPKAAALEAFLSYAVTTGQKFGPPLLFAPLPAIVVATNKTAIAAIS